MADQPHPPAPTADSVLIAELRRDLAGTRYEVGHLGEIVGEVAIAALDREEPLPARDAAGASTEPAAALMRLFTLGQELTRAELDRALPTVGADGAARLGLVRAAGQGGGDAVRAQVDLRPVSTGEHSWWLASDQGEAVTGAVLDTEHVLGVGAAGRTLAEITVPSPVRRALDLGTGCGIQALHAAGFCPDVVGTDLSARALAFASFNAGLNGVDLDLRGGDMLAPVAGETFDLIVSNPPFVITPRTEAAPITYRDGGRGGDDLIAHLVRALPDHLGPGGTAQFLANWEIPAGSRWSERLEAWTRDLDVDVWVIQREQVDPARYAETWLRDGGLTPERDREGWEQSYRTYLRDFAARDVGAIGFGYVMLRRRGPGDSGGVRTGDGAADGGGHGAEFAPSGGPWRRFEELTTPLPGGAGVAIGATLDAVPALAGDFLDRYYRVAFDVTEERHYRPGQPDPEVIVLHQGGGLGRSLRVSSHAAALVGACDGELAAGQIIGALAVLSEEPVEAVHAEVAPMVRELVLDGFLRAA